MGREKGNYRIKLEISIIAVLVFLILLFWSLPRIGPLSANLPPINFQRIQMIQIPRTMQKVKQKPPPPVRPSIPVASDDVEILDEIPVKASSEIASNGKIALSVPLPEDELPYIPRQIIEVLPKVNDLKISGEVIVRLLINTNGKVENYKVIVNTTGNPLCVQRVINAAKKSRWETIHLNETNVKYWITKRYQFK